MRAEAQIHAFVAVMWAMLLAGGGLFVLVLGPLSAPWPGAGGAAASSALKAAAAGAFVVAWIAALSRIKNWMFRRRMREA